MNNNYYYNPYSVYPMGNRIPNSFGTFNKMGANPINKISFRDILNGASKTLGVINQAIPVFYQVRPIVNNAKTMFKVVRGINSASSNTRTNSSNNSNLKENSTKKEAINAPIFFQ